MFTTRTWLVLGILYELSCSSDTDNFDDLRIEEFETPRVVVCDSSAEPLAIESIPSAGRLSFFQHVDPTCPPLPSTAISLVNTATTPVTIDVVSVNAPFFLEKLQLPRELAPQERLPLRLLFKPTKQTQQGATGMTVVAGTRCARIALDAQPRDRSDGDILSYSALAMDFGVVPVGTTVRRDLVFVSQPGNGSSERSNVGGFGASASAFEVGPHDEPLSLADCSPARVPIIFHAGPSPAIEHAQLAWEVSTSIFIGLQIIELVATVEAPP